MYKLCRCNIIFVTYPFVLYTIYIFAMYVLIINHNKRCKECLFYYPKPYSCSGQGYIVLHHSKISQKGIFGYVAYLGLLYYISSLNIVRISRRPKNIILEFFWSPTSQPGNFFFHKCLVCNINMCCENFSLNPGLVSPWSVYEGKSGYKGGRNSQTKTQL